MNLKEIRINKKETKILSSLETFRDLVTGPSLAVLSTISIKGYPHSTVVWFDFDGEFFRINTMKGFQKEKNIRRNPQVNLLIYSPNDPLRSVEIRGEVIEISDKDSLQHLNLLSQIYTGKNNYFGDVIPEHFQETEFPLICKIKPLKIVTLPKTRRISNE